MLQVKKVVQELFIEHKVEMESMFKEHERKVIQIISANTVLTNQSLDKIEKELKQKERNDEKKRKEFKRSQKEHDEFK